MIRMSFDADKRRAALDAFMQQEGLNIAQWELASKVGDGTLRKFMNAKSTTMTDKTLGKLAAGATYLLNRAVSMSEVLGEAVIRPPSPIGSPGLRESDETPLPNVSHPVQDIPLPLRAEMPRDLPVLGTSVGGDYGDFSLNGEVVDLIRRPRRLMGRTDVFALNVVGDSMWPWRRHKGLVVVEANRAPGIGDYVVIEMFPTDGGPDRPTLVKELVGLTSAKITLRQYKPSRTFSIDRKKVAKMYRVIDTDELLGI